MSKRTWVVGGLVVALALAGVVVAGMAASSHSAAKAGSIQAKGESAWYKAGVSNEGPSSTYEAQQAALRAYPAESIPGVATANAQATFAAAFKHGKKVGQWTSIGPSKAQYPGVLNSLGGFKPYTASGRVTALAIGGCKKNNKCMLYVGAAGGGVWVADNATEGGGNLHWQFKSGSFGTNAIGSLLVDPSDPSGNTVYAGTGEANASGDSEAGLGIYKSTDGGDTWTLVPGSAAFGDRAVSSMAFDKDGNLLVGIASAIRGVSSVTGGAVGCNTPAHNPCAVRGIWRQTGATFTLLRGTFIRGTTKVAMDPNNPNVLYQSSFAEGVWRSLDNGATWTQIKTALAPPGATTARNSRSPSSPAALRACTSESATPRRPCPLLAYGRRGRCGGLHRHDDPAEHRLLHRAVLVRQLRRHNTRGSERRVPRRLVLLRATARSVERTGRPDVDGRRRDVERHDARQERRRLDPPGPARARHRARRTAPVDCRRRRRCRPLERQVRRRLERLRQPRAQRSRHSVLQVAAVADPDQTTSLNKGLVTLQFQSFSVDPKHPKDSLMGGTQDNGTFEYKGSDNEWPQIMYGDGGQSGWNAADSKLRFNAFFGQYSDTNFRNGDPTKWVIATGPMVSSPEGSNFYMPIEADPTEAFAGSIFYGSQSVWRTQDWGGDRDYLEANCPEFTTDGGNPACGDLVRIGPVGARDLTAPNGADPSTTFGTDRAGLSVAAVERAPGNTGTIWAATNTGRVFIADNANAAAASVAWTRLDSSATNDPARFVSSIYVDPANANHAWISYSGYSLATPAQPGHVFEVTRTGATATWTNLTFNLADLPVTDLVRDDQTGDLYAATDFGVWTLPNGTTMWSLTGGMPMVEVAGLTIVPEARVLYAATHGLGGWSFGLEK